MIKGARQCPWGWEMVLIHVTIFKGQHKIQNRWENREYVVEWQPYLNLPVYVVHPIGGEVAAVPYIKISYYPSAITWSRMNVKMLWSEMVVTNPLQHHMQMMHFWLTGQPKADQKALPTHCQSSVNWLTQDWPGWPAQTLMDEGFQTDDDMPAPLRWSTRKMRNQLPLRYWNFAAWQNDTLSMYLSTGG